MKKSTMRTMPFHVGLCCLCALTPWGTHASAARTQGAFTVTSDGVRIWFETYGEGVPIVLIPGGPGGNCDRFRQTHMLLRSLGKVVLMDNRGRGLSDDLGNKPGAYTLDKDVLDVEAVRNALRVDKIVVFGHSYGSMVAMAYAARHPEHTLALITSAGVHGAKVFQERNIDAIKRHIKLFAPARWRRIIELREKGIKASEPELSELFGVNSGFFYFYDQTNENRTFSQFDYKGEPKSRDWNPIVYRQMVGDDPDWTLTGSLAGVELLPELKNYTGPALIMGGRHDRVCPPINQFEIAGALSDPRLVIFEHSGHNPHYEEPLRFLDVVTDFLQIVLPK